MSTRRIQAGDVFQTYILGGSTLTEKFYNAPSRIVAFDKLEVLFDSLWQTQPPQWSFSGNQNKRCTYYRRTRKDFFSKIKFLRHEPLTKEEEVFFRSDLPLQLCRRRKLQVAVRKYPSLAAFEKALGPRQVRDLKREKLVARKIVLEILVSERKRIYKRVEPANGTFFTGVELAWHGLDILSRQKRIPELDGFGIYRSGHDRGIPSFSIGGYFRYWNKEYWKKKHPRRRG